MNGLIRPLSTDAYFSGIFTTGQRASALIPAAEPGGLHEIQFESRAVMRSRTVILAPGAHWRAMKVPGEDTYRNRSVAYCPHCDGPLFKDKCVAVNGGGNSSVRSSHRSRQLTWEAILLEFADALRADSLLQDKLFSLPNVRIIMNAQTAEVEGDATTTPFKQIIVANGEGAKIGLSAFDYLIHLPSVTSLLAAAEQA